MSDLEEGYALGLDLGTTFSCIGVYRNGEVEIIPNRNGDRITPSVVTVLDNDVILKGEETLDYLVKNYDSTIFAIKRFIGREYNDKKVQEDIKKENFPFKMIGDKKGKNPIVEVKNHKFTLEEISSFVIRKLADNAEKFLNRKVKKLVITVPANFDNAQRNCTKQAALLADIEVLRMINEPTAAALAYGLQDKNSTADGKILVFDLGGGTFDVTILSIDKQSEDNFEIISTNGDKFLGGEDFDNKLVHYFLDSFCKKMNEKKEEILKDKKVIKKLKISCENIKKVLSSKNQAALNITNFYNKKDMMEKIKRDEFEELCQDLFEKLKKPLDQAIKDAKITSKDIKEIVLIGGSTRIPKIKIFLQEYFGKDCKINDSINPDEAVAYGATLMAAKILIKKDKNLEQFNLMDITPLSLGIAVLNDSKNEEIKKEGSLMSVVIKRATKIPYSHSEIYQTAFDYVTEVKIRIYEGEKKYVKYNHILGEISVQNLPKKKKGEVKIEVNFFIDVNGILTVTAYKLPNEGEEKKPVDIIIEYQSIGLDKGKIEELKEKNKKYYNKLKTPNMKLDFSNTREALNEFEDALKETTDEEDKYNIIMTYITTYEEFINSFDKTNFDNETMLEKYYIYLKQLFEKYALILCTKENYESSEENKNQIKENIKNYIKIFTLQTSGYLNDLLDILINIPKKIFYEIIVFSMEQMNIGGKKCLEERKQFCRYNSLMFFERAYSLFNNYISNITKMVAYQASYKKCQEELKVCLIYINEVKTGSILLLEDSIKQGQLIKSNNTGFTKSQIGFAFTKEQEAEKNEIILQNYEKLLLEINPNIDAVLKRKKPSSEPNIKEAICIANIVKINFSFLGKTNKRILDLCEHCDFIANKLGITTEKPWFKEFSNLYGEIKSLYETIESNMKDMRKNMREKYKKKFDELEEKFNKKKNNKEYIDFILKNHPYQGYQGNEKAKELNSEDEQEKLSYLRAKYHPDQYEYSFDNEDSQLRYCLVEVIESHLNNMFEKIQ